MNENTESNRPHPRETAMQMFGELLDNRYNNVKALLEMFDINPEFDESDHAAATAFCEHFAGSPDARKLMYKLHKAFFAEMLFIQTADRNDPTHA